MTLGLLSEYSRDYAGSCSTNGHGLLYYVHGRRCRTVNCWRTFRLFDSWPLVFTVLGVAALLQLLTVLPLRRNVYVD